MALQNIAVVSVDMFQTLVNVDSRCHQFWQQVLGDSYTPERAHTYWSQIKTFLHGEYRELFANNHAFVKAHHVAERSFAKMFESLGLDLDPAGTADIFVREHGLSEPFDDAHAFLQAVGKVYNVCLVSDADEEMLGPLRQFYPFDQIFTSEHYGAYKSSPGGELFRGVVEYYGLPAESFIHIGDSYFDVLGAGRTGMIACWLNRFGKPWEHEIRPHLEVHSLEQAAELLGVSINS